MENGKPNSNSNKYLTAGLNVLGLACIILKYLIIDRLEYCNMQALSIGIVKSS